MLNNIENTKFFKTIEKSSAKLLTLPFLNAIKNAFILIMPLIIIGSFANLIAWIRFDYNHFSDGKDIYFMAMSKLFGNDWTLPLDAIVNGTTKIIAILVTVFIAYYYAEALKIKTKISAIAPLSAAVLAFGCFWLTIPHDQIFTKLDAKATAQYLNPENFQAESLFLGIIIAIFCVRVYTFFVKRNITIKMPQGVPPGIAQAFASLIPGAVILITTAILSHIAMKFHFKSLNEIVFKILQAPLSSIGSSYPAVIIAEFVRQLLWLLGIHGFSIINGAINSTIWLPTLLQNIDTFKTTHDAFNFQNIAPGAIINTYGMIGGSGSTLGLLIAIRLFAKKSARLMSVFKIGIIPGLFNINEPVIFGLPIVLSPLYAIPFILAPILNDSVAYLAIALKYVPQMFILNSGAEPVFINVALTTGFKYIQPILLYGFLLILNVLIYAPFVKADVNSELKEKQEESKNQVLKN